MKKILRLTEADLMRLVKRVTNEQTDDQYQPVKLTQAQIDKMLRKFIMDYQKTNGLMVDGTVNGKTYPLMLNQGYFKLIP